MRSVLLEEKDKAFLVTFDTRAELLVDFTNSVEKLAEGIRSARAGGGTALYDAIYYACRDKLPEDWPPEQFRRALVILGDGQDNQSTVTREMALEMAHKAEAVIYAISTNQTREHIAGDKVLRRFARETGGVDFHPLQARDLEQSFADIANELRHQYFILYSPTEFVADGSFHKVAGQSPASRKRWFEPAAAITPHGRARSGAKIRSASRPADRRALNFFLRNRLIPLSLSVRLCYNQQTNRFVCWKESVNHERTRSGAKP